MEKINPVTIENVKKYGEIYSKAFSGEPWNDKWSIEDATTHVGELLESKQCYGLEYIVDGEAVGFIMGASMLFSYGRVFEINDLAVDPKYQRHGIAGKLMDRCLQDIKDMGMKGVHLITAGKGVLPKFYEKYGFTKEKEVILMGLEIKH